MKQSDKYICLLNFNKIRDEFLIDIISTFSNDDEQTIKNGLELLKNSDYQRYIRLSKYRDKQNYEKEKFNELKNHFDLLNITSKENEVLNLSVTQYALINKIEHMYYKGSGLKDIVIMLDSFKRGIKRLKTCQSSHSTHDRQYNWTEKDGNEKYSHKGNLPRGHFKWNGGTRYILSDEDLTTIADFINPIINHSSYENISIY